MNTKQAQPIATKATKEEAERVILDTLEANMITAPVRLPGPGEFVGVAPKEGAAGRTVTVYNLWGSFWVAFAPSHIEPKFLH